MSRCRMVLAAAAICVSGAASAQDMPTSPADAEEDIDEETPDWLIDARRVEAYDEEQEARVQRRVWPLAVAAAVVLALVRRLGSISPLIVWCWVSKRM